MRKVFTILFVIFTPIVFSQNDIAWDGKYQLQLSDFQSPSTQIGNVNIYSLHTSSGVDFSFYMSNFEFMFTKNFNSKVNNTFKRDAASLVAPDEIIAKDILGYAQYEFDLSELYTRKFRKKIFEEKGTFSNVTFFRPIYDTIQRELSERDTNAGKETDLGRKKDKLKMLHEQVLKEILELSDFCKECKPIKKKK
jgi:hypothetical protein